MFEAEVGDDVYGEDPTVNLLEKRAAEVLGCEAALFVPSGTMGNQIAIKLHTHHGQEIVCHERAHIFEYEMAMMAHFSGVVPRTVAAADGILTWKDIEPKLRPKSYHGAKTGLITLENTHNMGGGTVTPPEIFDEVCARRMPRDCRYIWTGRAYSTRPSRSEVRSPSLRQKQTR